MRLTELRAHLNNTYGIVKNWPKTLEVDAETYANACQAIFDAGFKIGGVVDINVGDKNGLMYKGVELIYKSEE